MPDVEAAEKAICDGWPFAPPDLPRAAVLSYVVPDSLVLIGEKLQDT